MAKKKTRLEELEDYAKGVGLVVRTWSPGDGQTRYRFFSMPVAPGQSYFGPANGTATVLGLKKAWDYLYSYGAGRSSSAHATKREAVHLLKTRGGSACGEGGAADADINFVTCKKCQRLHDKHEEAGERSFTSAKHLLAARAQRNARHARKKKLTAHDAKRLLESEGIDFSKGYYESVSMSDGNRIAEVAKMAGYKKSKNAPGSTGRMYYQYLSRLK
jgi:hypothetical protein